jgi:hypothetical protein
MVANIPSGFFLFAGVPRAPQPSVEFGQTGALTAAQHFDDGTGGDILREPIERGAIILPEAHADGPPILGLQYLSDGFQDCRPQLHCPRGREAAVVIWYLPVGRDQAVLG